MAPSVARDTLALADTLEDNGPEGTQAAFPEGEGRVPKGRRYHDHWEAQPLVASSTAVERKGRAALQQAELAAAAEAAVAHPAPMLGSLQ